MPTRFRTMHAGHKALLNALDKPMTSEALKAKLPQFELPRVRGLLTSLRFRGVVEFKKDLWFRTEAGDKLANG
jgi:hypothetical protein